MQIVNATYSLKYGLVTRKAICDGGALEGEITEQGFI